MAGPSSPRDPARLRRRELFALAAGAAAALASTGPARASRDPATQRYVCTEPDCAPYIYNPANGDPTQGIPAGTPYADLPDDWICPRCGGPKDHFIPLG